jgi:hypothetical protein
VVVLLTVVDYGRHPNGVVSTEVHSFLSVAATGLGFLALEVGSAEGQRSSMCLKLEIHPCGEFTKTSRLLYKMQNEVSRQRC